MRVIAQVFAYKKVIFVVIFTRFNGSALLLLMAHSQITGQNFLGLIISRYLFSWNLSGYC
jgi:hypothetical protein